MILKDTIINGLKEIIDITMDKYHFKVHNIYNFIVSPNWQIPHRTINDWMLVYIREGNGYYQIDNKKYYIKSGNIYFISNNIYHSAKYETGTLPNVIAIRFGLYNNNTNTLTTKLTPIHFCINTEHKWIYQQAFEEVYLYNSYPKDISLKLCHTSISRIFQMTYVDIMNIKNNRQFDNRMEKAKLYINDNITNNLTIDNIASYVKLSPKYFSKQFKKTYRISPKSYIFMTKIHYAKFLIEESNLSLKEIASIIGYSDQYIFSNQFKKIMGKSPSKISRN